MSDVFLRPTPSQSMIMSTSSMGSESKEVGDPGRGSGSVSLYFSCVAI